jgi:hypothetical protein
MTPSGGRLIVTATATACAHLVLALPRAIEPSEPPYFIPRIEEPTSAGAEAPADAMIDRLDALILARGAFERGGFEPPTATKERADRTALLARAIETHLGEEALTSAARRLARRIDRRVHGESDEQPEILGDFERQLARHGVTRDGERVGPRVVVRALAAARIAALVDMEPTRFMTAAEEEAYFAWAAIRPGADAKALRAFGDPGYERNDPVRAAEARAYFAYVDGAYDVAARLYRRVHEETGELRARNHSLAALVRAGMPDTPF